MTAPPCGRPGTDRKRSTEHVERVTSTLRGGQYGPKLCLPNGRRDADGSARICVSNDGDFEKKAFVVDRVLPGDVHPGLHSSDTPIGEWGGTHLPATHAPVLGYMSAGAVEWAPMTAKDGRQLAQVRAFQRSGTVDGVDARTHGAGDEDVVPLDSLAEAPRARC